MAGTEHEASVKLTLDNAQFIVAIKKVGDESEKAANKAARKFDVVGKGVDSVKRSFSELGSSIKSVLGTAVSLGGALAVGDMARRAAHNKAAYVQLAGAIEDASGQMTSSNEVQRKAAEVADKTATEFEKVQTIMRNLSNAGDLDQVADATGRAAMQAKRLGVDGELVARTYSRLIAKGVAKSGEEAEKLTEQMFKFGRSVLGVDIDEAIDPVDMAEFAAFVNASNSSVGEMTTLLSNTGKTAKDLGQALEVVEELGLALNTSQGLKDLRKESGLTTKQINLTKGSVGNLLAVLESGSPKAFKALQKSLATDRSKQALRELVGKDVEVLIETGKDKEAAAALKVKAAALQEQLKSAGDGAALMANAEKRNAELLEQPGAKLQRSINKIQTAFESPEVLNAMDDLAENLPAMADAIASFVSFAAKNPLLAGALGLGAKAGVSFLSGAATELIKAHVTGGGLAGATIKKDMAAGGVAAGKSVGSGMSGAAKAFAVAAVGFMAYELTSEQIDKEFKRSADAQNTTAAAGAAAAAAKSVDAKKKALERVNAAIAKEKENAPGFITNFTGAIAKHGAQTLNTIFGAGIDVPSKDPSVEHFNRIKQLEADRRRLEAEIKKGVEPKAAQMAGKTPPKPQPLKLDPSAPRELAAAVSTSLGGKVLQVRITNPKDIGGAGGGGGGGGRGTLNPEPPRSGSR